MALLFREYCEVAEGPVPLELYHLAMRAAISQQQVRTISPCLFSSSALLVGRAGMKPEGLLCNPAKYVLGSPVCSCWLAGGDVHEGDGRLPHVLQG